MSILSRKSKTKDKEKNAASRSRGRPKTDKLKIDVAWMKARMAATGFRTWAELSRTVGIDKAMMSKSLTGDRVFSAKDVCSLAEALKSSTDEIMRRIGYELSPRGVMVVGKITGDSTVSFVASRKGEIFNAPDAPPGSVALVAEGLPGYEGAVFVYVEHSGSKPVPLTMFGQLCVVEADKHLMPFLGTLVKGSGRGRMAVALFGSHEKLEVETVHNASPVVSINFA